eukprot:4919538-Prymnesium_polylepis.1
MLVVTHDGPIVHHRAAVVALALLALLGLSRRGGIGRRPPVRVSRAHMVRRHRAGGGRHTRTRSVWVRYSREGGEHTRGVRVRVLQVGSTSSASSASSLPIQPAAYSSP